ncbi:hypothetical protein KIN20_003023 [Parelaphostrongylus tenuis]|uniref:Uncharacterized protein n=1 Tax=Parelaphostrongylus tenuis TaxID=148309 RepID=A0AAD5QH54_PARTN|nr:hypothetical protein KIN20_003023 [Parelaphostrongylus tenuis]
MPQNIPTDHVCCKRWQDVLEDTSSADTDRQIDRQNFNCSQFEIFTHEYRERKEIANCEDHDESHSSCCSPSSGNDDKKRIVNTSRKLQKAVYSLQSMPGSEVISEMINKMKEIGDRLNQLLKQREAEFSTTNVPLAAFDTSDMQLLLGETEVPTSRDPFDEVEKSEGTVREQQNLLLFEADVMLQEYDHLKYGLRR